MIIIPQPMPMRVKVPTCPTCGQEIRRGKGEPPSVPLRIAAAVGLCVTIGLTWYGSTGAMIDHFGPLEIEDRLFGAFIGASIGLIGCMVAMLLFTAVMFILVGKTDE